MEVLRGMYVLYGHIAQFRYALKRYTATGNLEAIVVRNVLLRIAVWASAGSLVSFVWGLYFARQARTF